MGFAFRKHNPERRRNFIALDFSMGFAVKGKETFIRGSRTVIGEEQETKEERLVLLLRWSSVCAGYYISFHRHVHVVCSSHWILTRSS
jgi:hypothetical protein